MGYEEVWADYFKDRDTQAESLHDRFYELATYLGKLTISNLYKVWMKLNDERISAQNNLITAKQLADKYVGTGIDGIGAQMKYEKARKKASTYDRYAFEKLYITICREIMYKYNKLVAKHNKTQNDVDKIQILTNGIELLKSSSWEQFGYVLDEMITNGLKFEISAKNVVENCKKRF